MGELSNFCGHVVDLIKTDNSLSLRLLSWSALDEGGKPVLIISLAEPMVSLNSPLTFDAAKDNEYKIDSVEIKRGKLQVWFHSFDRPIEVESNNIEYRFEDLSETDLRGLLKISRTGNDEKSKQVRSLRNKIDSLAKFIDESENRLSIKSQSHPEGTEGYKIYKEQFKLIHRLRAKLSEDL